jgi:DNA-binding transcriptional ArsR family regulator
MNSLTTQQQRFKAQIFHALSDPDRLEILEFLRDEEKCVCEIVPHLSLIQPVVSRHLKILRDVGIIRCRKDGTKRMYSIVDLKILNSINELTPALISVLQKEVMQHMSCRPAEDE